MATGPRYQVSDTEIQQDVLAELDWEPSIDAADIGVTVRDGIVTLEGHVRNFAEKAAARRAARKIAGVKALVDELRVRLPGAYARTDADLAQDVLDTLRLDVTVPHERIQVTVDHGHVVLEGEVAWDYQRREARRAVENLVGVVGIDNRIGVEVVPKPKDVKEKIVRAFTRSATLDADEVVVRLEGEDVILTGRVRSLAEKYDAERAARSAPGVKSVRNEIIVGY